jgi:hypothetical protein
VLPETSKLEGEMKNFSRSALAILILALATASSSRADTIMQTYPDLEKFTYAEPSSKTYFGFGLSPVAIIGSRIGFSLDLFEVHYIKDRWDIEAFSASFGTAFGSQNGAEQFFLFRTAPKYRLIKNISVGPLLGIEFVSFENVEAQLNKYVTSTNDLFAPPEKFTSRGVIYGASICETFNFGKSDLIKINELIYKETYGYLGTNNGWQYHFSDDALNADPSPLQPSSVFMIEISFLY